MLNLTEIPIAESTRRVYLSALARLDKWLKGRPINDETLSDYLSYLFDRGKSPSTAEGALKAVRWRCESQDLPDPRGKLCRRACRSGTAPSTRTSTSGRNCWRMYWTPSGIGTIRRSGPMRGSSGLSSLCTWRAWRMKRGCERLPRGAQMRPQRRFQALPYID